MTEKRKHWYLSKKLTGDLQVVIVKKHSNLHVKGWSNHVL